jgi:hypothetical protein
MTRRGRAVARRALEVIGSMGRPPMQAVLAIATEQRAS